MLADRPYENNGVSRVSYDLDRTILVLVDVDVGMNVVRGCLQGIDLVLLELRVPL